MLSANCAGLLLSSLDGACKRQQQQQGQFAAEVGRCGVAGQEACVQLQAPEDQRQQGLDVQANVQGLSCQERQDLQPLRCPAGT